ncbi:PAS domain-containing sensor histidine kinase [Nonlabens antarcticus]|uniref:PAS domain-containing sensor histidine kinase n=1 Tax=Nonlabens antarcticus TaxID=392714 RepID=UPI0018919BC9|nr:PAS domain-containing sensor histidine kinase [Nonlabens antarcticus]
MDNSPPNPSLLQAPIAIAYLDKDLNYIIHSKKWCDDHKLNLDNIVGMNHYDLFPNTSKNWREVHLRVLSGCYESNAAEKFIRKDGSELWLRWSVNPTYDKSQIVNGMVMTSENITESMNARLKIDREHQLLLDASDKAKIGSWEISYLTGELYWSDVTKKIHELDLDYVPDVMSALNFYKPGINQEIITQMFTTSRLTGEQFDVDLQIITAKGNERWVRSVMKAEMFKGNCIRQFGTFEDITDKVTSDIRFKHASKKFHDVFEASGVGMLVIDPIDLKITQANPSICELLNFDQEHIKTASLGEFISKTEFPVLFNSVTDLLNKKIDHLTIDINLKKSTGRFVICSIVGTLIEDENGDPVDLVIQIVDISEIKKKEQELKTFTSYVERQNQRLLNFAHIVSHNLRSHSSNFEVLLQLYQQETKEADKNSIIHLLNSSSTQLSETIDHLNQVVALNTDKIELSTIYLKENIFKVMENISTNIKTNNVNVDVDVDDDFTIDASPAYLESILLNLLTNSIKYRKKNVQTRIVIKAFKYNGKCRIIFQDNGKGIDMKLNGHKVFGMYKTFHGNADARGLGLYMTKNQVEAMGGSIRVQSQIDVGTTFKITL